MCRRRRNGLKRRGDDAAFLQQNSRMTTAVHRFVIALVVATAQAGIGLSVPGDLALAAQAQSPCSLVTAEEIQELAPANEKVSDGVASSLQAVDWSMCRYTWGAGVDRYVVDVNVNPASRAFAGSTRDSIRQALVSSVRPGTADAAIADVGDAAVFTYYSPAYVGETAYVKERILQVSLYGVDAIDRKDELISLLKSAAERI
jgi:hypothetical protein